MKIFLLTIAMVSCTVVANLFMKAGAMAGQQQGSWLESLVNIRTLSGLVSFAGAAILYVLLLRQLPLNIAQSFLSVQFIAVILAADFVLGESITGMQWIGITLIAAGIIIVGWSRA